MTPHDTLDSQDAALTALERLVEGNRRFATGAAEHPHTNLHETATPETQVNPPAPSPFAVVLSCSDARVPVSRLFDRGVGDLHVVRVLGAVCGPDALASIEQGVEQYDTQVLLVLGQTDCPVATAAVDDANPQGAFGLIVDAMRPLVDAVVERIPDIPRELLVNEVVAEHVRRTAMAVTLESQAVYDRWREGTLLVVGAVYDVALGRVAWLGPVTVEEEAQAAA